MAAYTATTERLRGGSAGRLLVALVALLAIAAGVILLAKPSIAVATLGVIAGIFLLVNGAYEAIASFRSDSEHRGLMAVLGVVSVIAGVLLVRDPVSGVAFIALIVGIWLIAFGLVRLIEALGSSERGTWSAIVALVEMAVGTVIVASPGIGLRTLAVLVGIALVLRGIGMAVLAWKMHPGEGDEITA
jgi:uncharacterized membrane protein HdeD (DUF308 family)